MYSKKLGKRVAAKAKPENSKRFHVILSDDKKWAVVVDGKIRAKKILPSQEAAIDFAKEHAAKMHGQVVVHKNTGEVQDLFSFSK